MLEYFALPDSRSADHLVARYAERLGSAVKVQTVPGLVLNLGQQDRLAFQRRRPRQPVALGLHADDLGMRVLRNLANERAPIGLRHPVLGFDLFFGVDARLKCLELLGRFRALRLGFAFACLVQALRVHRLLLTDPLAM